MYSPIPYSPRWALISAQNIRREQIKLKATWFDSVFEESVRDVVHLDTGGGREEAELPLDGLHDGGEVGGAVGVLHPRVHLGTANTINNHKSSIKISKTGGRINREECEKRENEEIREENMREKKKKEGNRSRKERKYQGWGAGKFFSGSGS